MTRIRVARPRRDDETIGMLARRGASMLWILFGLGLLATLTDLVAGGPQRQALVGFGAARLAVLLVSLLAVRRAGTAQWVVVPIVAGACALVVLGPVLGALRHDFAIALMIDCGLCVGAAAFVPWGWRMQLVLVTTALLVVVGTVAGFGWSAISPQALAMTLCSLGISIYLALDHDRLRADLARSAGDIAASYREIDSLNRQLERRVVVREALLEDANRRLESFCQSLAADLRPWLASITEHLRGLGVAASGSSAESSLLVERIAAAAIRMRGTLDAMLEYVALADAAIPHEPVDLSHAAHRFVDRLRTQEPDRRIDVVIDPAMPASGDPILLEVAMHTLIDNAWKFTRGRTDARIEVGVRSPSGSSPEYFVRDNGVGFDMQHVGNLFQPFARLEAMDSFPGHGMGLARAARIVSRHGGTIRANGEAGRGAEFSFTLGAAPRPPG